MTKLTTAERKTLNEAHAIIARNTVHGASWQIGIQYFDGCPPTFDVTYFDSSKWDRKQHSDVRGATMADKIQYAIDREAEANKDEEASKKLRVEALRKQLSELTGESA